MKYYAHINSKNVLTGIDMSILSYDEYSSTNVQNIEVSEEVYVERDKYIYSDGEIVLNPNYPTIELNNKKLEKIEYNDMLRDAALNQGVTYKGVLFDSDTDQKTNLLATYQLLPDGETITWYGKDNNGLECTQSDLLEIGKLIIQLHSYCWNMNAYIKEQIENATTVEELDNIIIDYRKDTDEQ